MIGRKVNNDWQHLFFHPFVGTDVKEKSIERETSQGRVFFFSDDGDGFLNKRVQTQKENQKG